MQNLTRITQSSAGVITIDGDVVTTGDLTCGGTSNLNDPLAITDATNATSATTGSLKTAGGLGVVQAAWIGGLINVAGVATLANATDASNTTTAGTKVTGGLAVAKKVYIGETINVAGASTLTGAVTASGGISVADAKPVIQGMNTFSKCTLTSLTSAATVLYTAAQVINGFISDAVSEANAATLPAPAAIVAAIPGCVVGTSFEFILKNASSGNNTITLTASGASTIVGTATVAQNNTKRFKAIVTNVTGSSEAVVFYSLGTAVH